MDAPRRRGRRPRGMSPPVVAPTSDATIRVHPAVLVAAREFLDEHGYQLLLDRARMPTTILSRLLRGQPLPETPAGRRQIVKLAEVVGGYMALADRDARQHPVVTILKEAA